MTVRFNLATLKKVKTILDLPPDLDLNNKVMGSIQGHIGILEKSADKQMQIKTLSRVVVSNSLNICFHCFFV
mgnify:CR=1 FL=1